MTLVLAQAVEDLGNSSTLLGMILSGALLATATGLYRFTVNYRQTERGLNRTRMRDATRNARAAQHEAGLWQNRCGDLEYLLRQHGIPVPALGKELRTLLEETGEQDVRVADDPQHEAGSAL